MTTVSARVATSLFAGTICLTQCGEIAEPSAAGVAWAARAAPLATAGLPTTAMDLSGIGSAPGDAGGKPGIVTFGAKRTLPQRGAKAADRTGLNAQP